MKSFVMAVAANIAANTSIQASNGYRNSERVVEALTTQEQFLLFGFFGFVLLSGVILYWALSWHH